MTEKLRIDEMEIEALEMLFGHSRVRDTFLDLTSRGHVEMRTNPSEPKFNWEGSGKPTDKDIELDAAVRILIDMEFIAGVTDCGTAEFSVIAAGRAEKTRSVYDRMALKMKDKLSAGDKRSE